MSIHSGGTTGFKGAGVILDSRTILTAGHVVDQFENNASSLEVRAGHQNRSVGTQIVAFATITLHPNYTLLNNDGVADFDLAIVKLSEDLVFDDKVKSIEIARSCIFDDSDYSIGTSTEILGWGNSENGSVGSLKKADLDIFQLVNSSFWFDDLFWAQLYNESSMFATHSNTAQIYKGDSGGPCIVTKNNKEYLAGIISWGDEFDVNHMHPSIMADVFKMRDFIISNLEPLTYVCDVMLWALLYLLLR